MMRKYLFSLIFFLLPLIAGSQPFTTISLLSGYTMPNSSEWNYIRDVSVGGDIAVSWYQDWGYCDSSGYYPLIRKPYWLGMRGNFTYFPNAIAGQRVGVSGFLRQPLLQPMHVFIPKGDSVMSRIKDNLCLEMDFGLALYTDPYCRTPNPDNVFIGSYVNCLIQIGLTYSRWLSDYSQLEFGAKFAHSSNGYLKKPNKGLNYIQLSLGYTLPNKFAKHAIRDSYFDTVDPGLNGYWPTRYFDKWPDNSAFRGGEFMLSYAPGIVMPRYTGSKHKYFYAHTAQAGWLWRFNPARAVGATLDLTYNYSHTAVIAHWNEGYSLPFYIAASAVYEATWHRLTLHTALAAYITRSEHGTTPLYERVGLYYNLSKEYRQVRHYVGIALKSHMAHIDFIEWHYGIKFGKH